MKLLDVVREVRRHLEENGRVSLRMLRRQYELDDEALDELIEELVDVQRVARREENVLVWAGPARPEPVAATPSAPERSPRPQAQLADRAVHTGAAHHSGQVETRKVISIIFADLMGSTALQEGLDPESVNRVMDAYYQAVRGPVEAAGGTVVQLLGDGVLCAFGIPTIAEDDALRAVRAAMGIQQAFREFLGTQQWLSVPIGLRVAVNTGEVVVNDEHPAGIGDPLNVAARLQQEARDGEVLIGQTTRRLVADAVTLEQAGVFALKGRAETVTAYRVMSLERPTGAAAAAFVGRKEELARITAVYEAALAAPAARLVVLVASPGLGKSRLIAEVSGRLADTATVVTAHCDAVGGATFAPVAEAVREWIGNRSADPADPSDQQSTLAAVLPEGAGDRDRILAGITALLAGSPASPEETFFVIRRLLTALAQDKPVVLVIDDLHWAEPLLLDLVEHLIQWGSGVPLFVLIGARPELRDLRSSLVTPGGLVADVLTLSGLDAGAAMRLAANVIGGSDLPAAVAAKVLATSEGNPLFVGELVRMLVDEGAIERQGERWVVGAKLAALEMPPTIHALLAARIERLRPDERIVLERAAVVGRHFSRGAVSALLGRNGNELDALLEALRRAELIERDAGWFLGEPVLRFHHVLIRDAAYRRLLKGTRAELHERLAEWIEARAGDVAEHDETIGWHLEQAHQLLRELGPIDPAGRTLGERAARHLAAAGRRALGRDDLPVAADLLGRAVERLDVDDASRADLALDWCEALLAAGDVGAAAMAIDELGRFAGLEGTDGTHGTHESHPFHRLRAWHTCFAGQLTVLTAPQGLQAAADAVATAAAELAKLGDAAGEAKAHSVHATALARLGKVGACEAALDQALAAARRGGDRRRANAVLAGAPLAALWGPSPVTRASGRCLDVVRVLRITQGAPAVESVALSCQGVLEALRGRTEAARRMLASSRKMVEDLGIAHRLFETDAFAGRIAAMEGDDATAERLLRSAYDGLRDLGLGIDAARAGALLARALLSLDRVEEAEALSHDSEALAGDDLQAAIAWRGVRAEALAKRGAHAAAIELAKAAVAIASATDALLDHADARVALAVALRAAGRAAEADAEERRAIELWEAKGATLLAERARREVERIEAVAPTPGQVQARDPSTATTVGAPADHEAEALARFEALPVRGGPGTSRPTQRRVRRNAATAMQDRFDAALAARDFDGVAAIFDASHQEIDHPTGSTYGRDACIASLQRLFRSRQPHYEVERLATLGDRLLLVRRRSGASGAASGNYDVGAYENEAIQLFETNAAGLCCRAEVFAGARLGDAIVRLYQRYAAMLPEGPERAQAAAVAQITSVTTSAGDADHFDRLSALLAPDFVGVDHRQLSTWSVRGAAAYLEHLGALRQVGENIVFQRTDVLALEPGAFLERVVHSGTDRLGGGVYERSFLNIFAANAAGRLSRAEWFDDDRDAQALARFEELAAAEAKPAPRRRVRANAATRGIERFQSVVAARDGAALAEVFAESLHTAHHATRATYGRREMLSTWRSIMKAERLAFRSQILASLGGALALERHFLSLEGLKEAHVAGFGRSDFDEVVVIQTDGRGRWVHCEIFAADRLSDAVARLYERHTELLPEGPAREHAAARARTLAVALQQAPQLDTWSALVSDAFELVDHRVIAMGSLHGGKAMRENFRAMFELQQISAIRVDDVLAAGDGALLFLGGNVGLVRASGGAFERIFLQLWVLDDDGHLERIEHFDAQQRAEAEARFEAVVAGGGQPHTRQEPFANAASRSDSELFRCFNGRDWEGVLACVAPVMVFDERRRLVRNTCDRDVWLEQFRFLFDVPTSRFTSRLRATRGERLALNFHRFEGEVAEGGGPLATEDAFALHEVDGDGRIVGLVLFDLEDEEAAHAELDARFAAGEGALHPRASAWVREFQRAFAAREWEAMAALHATDQIAVNHRTVGWGTLRGPGAWVTTLQALVELAADAQFRLDHLRICERGILWRSAWQGTRDGGPFETPLLVATELDDLGLQIRMDVWDADVFEPARARFGEMSAGSAVPPADSRFANTASRLVEREVRCWATGDWEGLLAELSPAMRMDDRRRIMRLEIGYDDFVAQFRLLFAQPASRWQVTLLATRGERLSLHRTSFTAQVAEDGGALAVDDHLSLTEVDADGRWLRLVTFDLDDEVAAYAELDARWAAHSTDEHARAAQWLADYLNAFALRAWTAMTALFTTDLVGENHRLVGWGTRQGPEGVVSTLQAQIELAPDTQERVDHVRTCDGALLFEYAWHGTREGGAFENLWLVLVELAPDGRACRVDVWEPEQLDQARARFDELVLSSPRSGRIEGIAAPVTATTPFENAASRAWHEVIAALQQRDVERFATLHPPRFRYRDHRRLVQLDLDRDGYLAFARPLLEMRSTSAVLDLLATRDERLALVRPTLAIADDSAGPSAVESLLLIETDAHGTIIAYDRYELDDEDAAQAEIQARWEAGEGAANAHAAAWTAGFDAAIDRRDWDAAATFFAPAFVAYDHRLVSWGALHGPAGFLVSAQTLVELAPDGRIRTQHVRALGRALLQHKLWAGTRDGGAFENSFLGVIELDDDGRAIRMDVYDPHHLDRALARFAEIRAGEGADSRDAFEKGNTVTALLESWPMLDGANSEEDWEALRASCAPDMVFEDREAFARLSGDREMMIASLRERVASGARAERRVLGTAGERVAVTRMLWTGGPADGRFEIEYLTVVEIDEAAQVAAILLFDARDERGAQREAWRRWAAIDPVAAPWLELLTEIAEAWNSRDRSRLRATFTDHLVVEDHRHTGIGRIEDVDAYVESSVVLWDLAPDQRLEFGWSWPAVDRHGFVVTIRREGTVPDGGPFESEYLMLQVRNDSFTRVEFFEIDALERALARFEELRPPGE